MGHVGQFCPQSITKNCLKRKNVTERANQKQMQADIPPKKEKTRRSGFLHNQRKLLQLAVN